jgi:hypothetical protein
MTYGCAGYQLGSRTLYRPDVYSIYVPVFESDSYRRFLGEQLTEAVVKQIELKTPYKVTSGVNADSTLSGRITSDSKYVVAENVNDEPRDIEFDLRVVVSWRDSRGDLIGSPTAIRVPDGLTRLGQAEHLVPEGGQSIAVTQLEAIDQLAQQIVATMEVPW